VNGENRNKKLTQQEQQLWAATQEGIPIERARAYIELAEIEREKYKFKDAVALYDTALELIEAESEIDYAPDLAQVLYEKAGLLSLLNRYEEEIEVIDKAIDVAAQYEVGDVPSLLRAAGRAFHALKDDESSIKSHQIAHEYPDPDVTQDALAIDHLNIGMSLNRLKRYNEAIERLQIARDAFKKLKEPKWVAICDGEIAETYVGLNDGVNIEKYAQLALGTAQIVEDRYRQWWLHYFLGIAKRLQGELDQGLEHLEIGRNLALSYGCEEFRYLVKVDLEVAEIYAIKGMEKLSQELQRRARNVEEILEVA
jgi:tetratricopeptide (TPR) repeat protein